MATREQMMADLQRRSQRLQQDPAALRRAQEATRERRVEAFEQHYPGFGAWATAAAARGFSFASDMLAKVKAGEPLSDNMRAAIERCMKQDAERAEQRAAEKFVAEQRAEPVNTVNLQAVEQAFGRALQAGIRHPKLTLDGFTLSPAKTGGRNEGAIYVKQGRDYEGTYLGKVLGGAFLPTRECDDDTKQRVLAAMADPLAAAVAYGQKFGKCAVCARDLTDPESIERGIGPICAERMGWA
jgi:hypothetical protein